jgi:transcriptional regulator with XRE-family HTH domain
MKLDNQVVGNVIQRLRNQKGLSQEVLSGFAGIARTHLTMIENGTKMPNLETIFKISEALNIKPSELIKEIENIIAIN